MKVNPLLNLRDFGQEIWLDDQGARPQRLLWASTGTKNPAYSDVKYVEPLVGPDTINTVALKTLEAYRDHGHPGPRLRENLAQAEDNLRQLQQLHIDLSRVTQRLEDEGIEKFSTPFDGLMDAIRQAAAAALAGAVAGK